MDVTGGLAPAVTAMGTQVRVAVKALTDAGMTMEAQALQAAHDDLVLVTGAIASDIGLLDGVLTKQLAPINDFVTTYKRGLQIVPMPTQT